MKATKIRPSVMKFALAMEDKLRQNDHRPHWRNCSNSYLYDRLMEECSELLVELINSSDPDSIIKECADVSNFAMMIADNALSERDKNKYLTKPINTV